MVSSKLINRLRDIQPALSIGRILSSMPKLRPEIEKFLPKLKAIEKQSISSPIIEKHRKIKLIVAPYEADKWTKMEANGLINAYLQLSKARLTALITTTAMGGFIMSPAVMDPFSLAACAFGTALLSASANACNHLLEAPYDAQMKRTQSRVLVVHRFTPLHAAGFAALTCTCGLSILLWKCNPLTASLGLLNVFLYAGLYTPMKRHHTACTWIGAVVGAIPPIMGYAASSGCVNAATLVLAGILYAWQFPHFNGLSWNLRGDYSRAGYRVMCVTNEKLCRATTIRHAVALLFLCSIASPLSDLTTWTFALDSLPVNIYMIYLSYRFYQDPSAKTSRNLFRYSLLYLPLIMTLMIISKSSRNCDT